MALVIISIAIQNKDQMTKKALIKTLLPTPQTQLFDNHNLMPNEYFHNMTPF